jgi:hypothetical protein
LSLFRDADLLSASPFILFSGSGVTGCLSEVRSADSLARQMYCLYELAPSERKLEGDAARRRMEEIFSDERVVNAYLNCLSA